MPSLRFSQRRSWYLPSVLLVGIACAQLWLAHTTLLSPWAGGGFGMFSTTDMRGNRHLHVFALRPSIRRELAIPPSLSQQVQRVLAFPSEAALRALAVKMAEVPTPDEGPLTAIEIQVWATRFSSETSQPSGMLFQALEIPIDARES